MSARTTRTRNRLGTLACSVGVACMLASPTIALAQDKVVTGTNGTTDVTVQTSNENIKFSIPTIIPFAAAGDGELVGPTASETLIKNLSVFGIHVTNMSVEEEAPWILVADAESAGQDNSVDFQVGPSLDMKDAINASQEGGIDLSKGEHWDMDYAGGEDDFIELKSSGNISHATVDLSGDGAKIATISWTVAPGQHVS
ncbi:hypothetical protein H6A29_00430 [Collinsella tanakaei]|nr:hypothetical protein [Collinsella tanakaei]